MMPYVWYSPINSIAFSDLIVRTFTNEIKKISKSYIVEEIIFELFKLIDTNQDYLIDKNELELGITNLFTNISSKKSSPGY